MKTRKAIFVCGREPSYARNVTTFEALKQCNVTLIPCVSSNKNYLTRHLDVLWQFIIKSRQDHDFIFIGFLGQLLIFFINLFSRKPIILDAFLSIHETLCDERKTVKNKLLTKIIFSIERQSCKLATTVLLDTNTNIKYFVKTFNLPEIKFKKIWVGCNTKIYSPQTRMPSKKFVVVFVGSYIPVQGVQHIIHAAKLLESEKDIEFHLIGRGVTYQENFQLATELGLDNIKFIDFMPEKDLPKYISQSDVGLGIFGSSHKAERSIPNKVFQLLAMEKPIITIDCPALRELLTHNESVYFCQKANPSSLADAIKTLKNNNELRSTIAKEGYNIFIKKCTIKSISNDMETVIKSLEL